MGAQQGKELGGGQGGPPGGRMMVPGAGQMSPHPHHAALPPMAGRMGERQGSRIKGLRPPKQRAGAGVGGNIFAEHSGE